MLPQCIHHPPSPPSANINKLRPLPGCRSLQPAEIRQMTHTAPNKRRGAHSLRAPALRCPCRARHCQPYDQRPPRCRSSGVPRCAAGREHRAPDHNRDESVHRRRQRCLRDAHPPLSMVQAGRDRSSDEVGWYCGEEDGRRGDEAGAEIEREAARVEGVAYPRCCERREGEDLGRPVSREQGEGEDCVRCEEEEGSVVDVVVDEEVMYDVEAAVEAEERNECHREEGGEGRYQEGRGGGGHGMMRERWWMWSR
ncbi:hypothetical protein EDC01DRAFT_641050 [Geopyxis carbonaria]|nr:hypothetical protein EDC01DRAFT_641050 [Geopyxis carbonaria]